MRSPLTVPWLGDDCSPKPNVPGAGHAGFTSTVCLVTEDDLQPFRVERLLVAQGHRGRGN
jgi:hypothetical protein